MKSGLCVVPEDNPKVAAWDASSDAATAGACMALVALPALHLVMKH